MVTHKKFNPAERKLIQRLKTPQQVQRFILKHFSYNREHKAETLRSFRMALHHKKAHCLEAVFIAAAVMGEHGYPPTVLDLTSIDNLDHVLFLYKRNGKYGTVGFSRCEGLYGRPAKYRSIKQLVMSFTLLSILKEKMAELLGFIFRLNLKHFERFLHQ